MGSEPVRAHVTNIPCARAPGASSSARPANHKDPRRLFGVVRVVSTMIRGIK
jgi:hypothetical protein